MLSANPGFPITGNIESGLQDWGEVNLPRHNVKEQVWWPRLLLAGYLSPIVRTNPESDLKKSSPPAAYDDLYLSSQHLETEAGSGCELEASLGYYSEFQDSLSYRASLYLFIYF